MFIFHSTVHYEWTFCAKASIFARVFSFSRSRRERLVRFGSGQATVEPSIKCVSTPFIAKIILDEAVAAPAATADQNAVRPSPPRRPRVSKLARRPRLSSCPLVLVPSFACVDRGGQSHRPTLCFRAGANFATALFAQDRVSQTTRRWRAGRSAQAWPEW